MGLQNSYYHRTLRVASAVCAFVLLFESGLVVESTARMATNTHQYLANAVSMSAAVQPTELNSLTADLSKQKQLLDAREAQLREREIAVELNGGPNQTATYVLSSILFVLLLLIITNYVLDYLRAQAQIVSTGTQTV
jgi:hypothetical protein